MTEIQVSKSPDASHKDPKAAAFPAGDTSIVNIGFWVSNMATISLASSFRAVTLIFASAATFTGLQAVFAPAKFALSFGIRLPDATKPKPTSRADSATPRLKDPGASAYVSIMGARQLATGLTLFAFAYQGKWAEAATILSIIGIVVAGTDGWHIARTGGSLGGGVYHAGPGAAIAILAAAYLWNGAY